MSRVQWKPQQDDAFKPLLNRYEAVADQLMKAYALKMRTAEPDPGVLAAAKLQNGVAAFLVVGNRPGEMVISFAALWQATCETNGVDPAEVLADLRGQSGGIEGFEQLLGQIRSRMSGGGEDDIPLVDRRPYKPMVSLLGLGFSIN